MTKIYLGRDVYDVDLTGVSDDQILVYDQASGKFKPEPIPSAGLGDMLKSVYDTNNDGVVETAKNVVGGAAEIASIKRAGVSGASGSITNNMGGYLHLGDWAVGRTAATAVLVNTAYQADYLCRSSDGTVWGPDQLGIIPLPFGAWVVQPAASATFTGNQPIYLFPDNQTGFIETSVVVPASWYGKTMYLDFWWWHGTSGGNCDIALEGRYQNTGSLRAAADFTNRQQLNANNAIRKSSFSIGACYPPVEIPCGVHLRLIRWGAAAGDTAAVDMYYLCGQLRVY